uniref:Uncharacterized protein n=1 Tax=Candidatus Kentrum sp. MB TaxID=2138164 RepID=A0A450X5C3_9GAMM|nr:MAG: hypothetical protein BECKMB1821G_GA0114241_100854 [Candidatus Kentron sp. MB]VFK30712.1 MAG: hypothetical protein BECKMB1821I_GA0114274_101729 [Candidatus Kentron sp. MB]VFK75338.1 MAG: hypothetical protein BECKMB1821H_GA0114242_102013 [Candidatus Kentron sp. MB]
MKTRLIKAEREITILTSYDNACSLLVVLITYTLLWMLLEGKGLLLLEESELSLAGIIGQLAPLISTMQRAQDRQVLISTHSNILLGDPGIDGREVLVLTPDKEGTDIRSASDFKGIKALLASGFTVGEVALPQTTHSTANQLSIAIG